jgi:hypothetical protein
MDERGLGDRRRFITGGSCLALGVGLWSEVLAAQAPTTSRPALREGLNLEELDLVEQSRLAGLLKGGFGKGNSCAESGLLAALRYLGKPEELVWAAAAFGGGLGKGELCGFLTSGGMALGLAAGMASGDPKQTKKLCRQMMSAYWQDWAAVAPHQCREIRRGHRGFKVCTRVGLLAFTKLEVHLRQILPGLAQA